MSSLATKDLQSANPFMPRETFLTSVIRTFETFWNNFGINPKITNYLKESCGLDLL